MAKKRKDPTALLSRADEIQRECAWVMDEHSLKLPFCALYQRLMETAGAPLLEEQAEQCGYSDSLLQRYRKGLCAPNYNFIRYLVERNPFRMNPERLAPADEQSGKPAGQDRIKLFNSAGFIEVTPASIRHWNDEVILSLRRVVYGRKNKKLHYGEVIGKLLSFHTQGERDSLAHIQEVAHQRNEQIFAARGRLDSIVTQVGESSEEERRALAVSACLTHEQTDYIETQIRLGNILVRPLPGRQSAFSTQLKKILERLEENGINREALSRLSISQPGGKQAFYSATLRQWENAQSPPALPTLRAVEKTLQRIALQPDYGISTDDIKKLMQASGYSKQEINGTTHTWIAQMEAEKMDVRDLMRHMFNAADMEIVTTELLDGKPHVKNHGVSFSSRESVVVALHRDGPPPQVEKVRELLLRMNDILQARGALLMSEEEILKVTQKAEAEQEEHNALTHEQRTQKRREYAARAPVLLTPHFG